MKGIFPWETLSNKYFQDKIIWEFTCHDKVTDNPEKLSEFWLPDEHDLKIRTILKFSSPTEQMLRVLSETVNPKWILSWYSNGTSLCGSSDLVSHNLEYIDIVCNIPMGSCSKSLTIEPVAIVTGSTPDKDGLFSPPPGGVLTLIKPLIINLGEAPAFPLFEKYGDGHQLIKWSIPDNLSENLNEDISRLISVEIDMNHFLSKQLSDDLELAVKQKKGLIHQIIIGDYLRILCWDDQIIKTIIEDSFAVGSAGHSIKWLLTEIKIRSGFSEISDLIKFFHKNPVEISKVVDILFSGFLSK